MHVLDVPYNATHNVEIPRDYVLILTTQPHHNNQDLILYRLTKQILNTINTTSAKFVSIFGVIYPCHNKCQKLEIWYQIANWLHVRTSNLSKIVQSKANGRIWMCQVSFTFGVPFPQYVGKGKCWSTSSMIFGALSSAWRKRELLHAGHYKVEIYFPKIGFMDCKFSNLNATGSCAPWCHALCGPLWVLFPLDAGKGNCYMWVIKKWKDIFPKIGFMDYKWSNSNVSGSCARVMRPL